MPTPPIAILGLGCVLPGALDPAALWRLVRERRSALAPADPASWRLAPDAGRAPPSFDRGALCRSEPSSAGIGWPFSSTATRVSAGSPRLKAQAPLHRLRTRASSCRPRSSSAARRGGPKSVVHTEAGTSNGAAAGVGVAGVRTLSKMGNDMDGRGTMAATVGQKRAFVFEPHQSM